MAFEQDCPNGEMHPLHDEHLVLNILNISKATLPKTALRNGQLEGAGWAKTATRKAET